MGKMLDLKKLQQAVPKRGDILVVLSGDLAMTGWVVSKYFRKCYRYESEYDLLRALEGLCDGMGFPQPAFAGRTFGARQKRSVAPAGRAVAYGEGELESIMENEKATFIVNVMFRKNATFQGSITWVEREKTQYFRSAFEMLKLMDEARRQGSQDPVCWQEDRQPETEEY